MTIKETCSTLTSLLHQIRQRKFAEGEVEVEAVADVMALFAQLSGQHTELLNEAQEEYDRVYDVREQCEEEREVLDEQRSYMAYLDTEYDVRPWRPKDPALLSSIGPDSADHTTIKHKLDQELKERRELCERSATLGAEVAELRASEERVRAELERVRKIMEPIGSPAFLEGVEPCAMVPTELAGPLFTLHQLLYTASRQVTGVAVSVTTVDPLPRQPADDLLTSDPSLLVLSLSQSGSTIVFRYHPKINCVTCDDNLPDKSALCRVVAGDGEGTEPPHTALLYHLPALSDLIRAGKVGRVFCWLHELCGLPVVTQRQRAPSNITANKFLQFLSSL